MPGATSLPPSHLLYLHGFRSGPRSFKAERMRAWLAAHRPEVAFWCPQLPPSPRAAITLVEQGIALWPADRMAVCGSSLGGFYAAVIAERTGCPAVLLNPAVEPARDLAAHIGEQTAFHAPDDPAAAFFFRPEFIDELRALAPWPLTRPERCLAIVAQGDEVLDWREMVATIGRAPGARIRSVAGSDHALSDFDDHLPHLLRFLHLCD